MKKQFLKVIGWFFGVSLVCAIGLITYLYSSYTEHIEYLTEGELITFNNKALLDRSHPTIPVLYFANNYSSGNDLLEASKTDIVVKSDPERFDEAKVVLIQEGFLDDSLFYQKFEAILYKSHEQWFISEMKKTSRNRQ